MISLKLADEINDLYDEVMYLRAENARLRKVEAEYNQFVYDSIVTSQQSMANWIGLLVSDAVTGDPR